MRQTKRLGPQVVYFVLEDGRELIHKEVPRQERPAWRPGAPWAELVWVDYLASEGLPVPSLVAADVHHGWLVERFVAGRLLSEGMDSGVFAGLLNSVLQVEAACEAAPSEVRAHSARGTAADVPWERTLIARWVSDEARAALDRLVEEAFSGSHGALGPVDIRPENALDAGDGVVLIDFAVVGSDDTERRIAGYSWRARPFPQCALTQEHYKVIDRALGRASALRLAFYDFAYCARALDRVSGVERHKGPGEGLQGRDAVESVLEEWTRDRVDDERIVALQSGLRFG